MAKLQCPHCGFGTMLCYKTIPESDGILFRYLSCPSCGFRARRVADGKAPEVQQAVKQVMGK